MEAFEKLYSDAALSPVVSNDSKSKKGDASREGHALFNKAQAVVSKGYALLEQFREADKQLDGHKLQLKLPTETWKQDKQDNKEILACGREYGEKLVENRLAPNAYSLPQHDKYSATDKEKTVAGIFKDSRKASDENTWGTIAADQVQKITALIKTVPPKGPERVYGI